MTLRFRPLAAVALLGAVALGACNMTRAENQFLPPTPLDVASRINATDARLATNALVAALNSNTFGERRWRNEQNGHEGAITTVRNFNAGATRCTEYRELMQVGPGESAIAVNTACLVGSDWHIMAADGGWRRIA